MSKDSWRCRVIRTTDGDLVMALSEGLAEALNVTSGDDLEVSKERLGMFGLWKVESPIDWSTMVERMNRISRKALDDEPST